MSICICMNVQFRKPMWPVFTGRKDGRVTNASEALRDLPAPNSNFTTLHNAFARFGLDDNDLVALSGNSNNQTTLSYLSTEICCLILVSHLLSHLIKIRQRKGY